LPSAIKILFEEVIGEKNLCNEQKIKITEIIENYERSVQKQKKPLADFIRIHRSFVVNTQKITRFTANEVEVNGIELNIGRTYKKEVAKTLNAN